MVKIKQNKIKKILITGSSGMIGTSLFKKLLENGYEVIGFDKKINKWSTTLNKLTIVGNLLDREDIEKIPKNVDLVIHLAANARVHNLVVEPDLALENVISLYNVVDFIRKNNIKNIIFSSSREVYGNRKEITSKEEDVDISLCESTYSASKIFGESFITSSLKCYKINYIICRFSNVYGMYDESRRFFPLLLKQMKKNEEVKIYGKEKILDFTYIDDCVAGIIKCVENFSKAKNNVFNIASGKGKKLTEVAEIIKKELGSRSKITIKNSLVGEVEKFIADISKAKKMLGYYPKYSVEEGAKMSINWYSKNVK